MDHKWSRDLIDLGCVDMGFSLIARLLGFGDSYYLTNYPTGLPLAVLVRVPLPTEPDAQYLFDETTKGPGNFPYGLPVPPDEPV